jgi:UDP-N-acetylmuramate dehydrogenase
MMNWWRGLKGKVRLGAPLEKYTTFKIGGPARFFIEPKDKEDLKLLLGLRKK